VGANVIAVANDKKGRYVNGSQGTVTECFNQHGKPQYVTVKFKDNNTVHKLKRHA
jgi:hypothetical protein